MNPPHTHTLTVRTKKQRIFRSANFVSTDTPITIPNICILFELCIHSFSCNAENRKAMATTMASALCPSLSSAHKHTQKQTRMHWHTSGIDKHYRPFVLRSRSCSQSGKCPVDLLPRYCLVVANVLNVVGFARTFARQATNISEFSIAILRTKIIIRTNDQQAYKIKSYQCDYYTVRLGYLVPCHNWQLAKSVCRSSNVENNTSHW